MTAAPASDSRAQRLRARRLALGLTQREVGERAGISQPNLAAIERGSRPLGSEVERRLVEALAARPSELLERHRQEVLAAAAEHGIANVRVFGSVAQGMDTPASDVDLLVTVPDEASPWALVRFARDVEHLLAIEVDVVDDDPAGAGPVLDTARREAVPL